MIAAFAQVAARSGHARDQPSGLRSPKRPTTRPGQELMADATSDVGGRAAPVRAGGRRGRSYPTLPAADATADTAVHHLAQLGQLGLCFARSGQSIRRSIRLVTNFLYSSSRSAGEQAGPRV